MLQTSQSTPLLVVDDVHVDYKTRVDSTSPSKRPWNRGRMEIISAVRGVSFAVTEGESLAILGRNGCGKSTLLSAMAGLLTPTKGAVWAECDPVLLGVKAALEQKLSGARNIFLGGLAGGMRKAEVRERFDEIVDFAGLRDAIHRPMSTYSSGMKARLTFAVATSISPRILFIDEALATGDEDFRLRAEERVRNLRSEAGCVILVSHSVQTIRETCDRAIWMDQGKLLADGPADDVVTDYVEWVRANRASK